MFQDLDQGENGDNDLQKQKRGLQTVCKSIFPGFGGNQLLFPSHVNILYIRITGEQFFKTSVAFQQSFSQHSGKMLEKYESI
jgi:hypothetical protein